MGINIKPRLSWLDNSKMMAMLLVIIYHVGSFANLGEVGPAIESFNMPLFMILSGYACYHSLFRDKTIREWGLYIKKNFMRIMIPCIFVSAWSLPWTHDKLFFLHGYWFLQCLFFILLASALIEIGCAVLKIKETFWPIAIMLNIAMLFVTRNNLSEMTSYFTIGLILRRYDVLNILFGLPLTTRIVGVVGGVILWSVLYGLFYKSFYLFPFIKLVSLGDVHIFILRHIQGVVMAVSVIILMELISKECNKFSYWGSKTLGMYLIHVFIVDNILNRAGFKIVSTGSSLVDIAISLLLAFFLCFITILICKISISTRITRLLILGEK